MFLHSAQYQVEQKPRRIRGAFAAAATAAVLIAAPCSTAAANAAPIVALAADDIEGPLALAPDGYIGSAILSFSLDREYLPWSSSGEYSVTLTVESLVLKEYSAGNTVVTDHHISPQNANTSYVLVVVRDGVREQRPVTLSADNTIVIDGLVEGVNVIGLQASYFEEENALVPQGTMSKNVEVGSAPPPIAADDETTGPQGAPQSIDPLANDSAGSDDLQLEPDSLTLLDADGEQTDTVVVPGEGVYTVENRRIVFTPEPGFTGTATPVQYQVTDQNYRDWATATYTPTVTPVAPVVTPDATTGPQGEPQSIDPLANDSAGAESAPLDPGSLTLLDADGAPTTTVTVPGEGVYTLEGGLIVFTPEPAFTGTATPVAYRVADALGNVASSTYTPTVTPAAPVDAPADPAPEAAGSTPVEQRPAAPGAAVATDPAATSGETSAAAPSHDAGDPPAALATTGGGSLSPLHGWIVALFGGGLAALVWGSRPRRVVRQTDDA
ncbi:Ig-like domain-containing protein [Leucobacter chromiiresistens]|uniref:CshA-type fibril repeat-containing protein n=1 Tax=Leucobacter chromiiresistens TaxID=1079994 RepID=A0A1H1BEB8_9MICO|nr:Ig-like domain-containing protein [Leucobacter chromiiresistens]SDQ50308.1 CshA-type fibril repeat-containing protein [Leucobacter chromiiresistens]